MEIWDKSKEDQAEWDEIYNAPPEKLFLIASDTFLTLRELVFDAIDGRISKRDEIFIIDVEIPASAIIAYCDTKTNIDPQFIVELLHALHAETINVRSIGGGPTDYRSKRSANEYQYLLDQVWKTSHRLSNHLFSIASDQGRAEVQKTLNEPDLYSGPIPCKVLRVIFAVDGVPISQETLLTMIEDETIRTDKTRDTTKRKLVLKSCLPDGWEKFLRKRVP